MYIGYLRIKNNKIVEANRDFIVRVENENEKQITVERTNVAWEVKHMFTDSNIDAIAYMLSTTNQKRFPSNTAIFVGSKGRDNKITGHMHYMMKDPNSWLLADKILEPMKPKAHREKDNPFIDCVNINKWMNKQYPEKKDLTCVPLERSK